jgi:AhpD family alkylhydroperoxidase
MTKSKISAVRHAFAIIAISMFTLTLAAQKSNPSSYEKTKEEIAGTFGIFPQIFDAVPEYALSSLWESFKTITGPDSNLEPKYRELISLSVAAQIPCSYCVYFHTEMAKAHGATQQEIQDAIAQGAFTRQMSMIIQGSQLDLDEFKKEFHQMMDYSSKHAKQ